MLVPQGWRDKEACMTQWSWSSGGIQEKEKSHNSNVLEFRVVLFFILGNCPLPNMINYQEPFPTQ